MALAVVVRGPIAYLYWFGRYLHFWQVTGKCGSVLVRLIPAPRGTSIVAAAVPKKLLQMAGVSDCYTSARGQTATLGNFGEDSKSQDHRYYNWSEPEQALH